VWHRAAGRQNLLEREQRWQIDVAGRKFETELQRSSLDEEIGAESGTFVWELHFGAALDAEIAIRTKLKHNWAGSGHADRGGHFSPIGQSEFTMKRDANNLLLIDDE